MFRAVCQNWWVLLLRGLAAIALGVCAILWPGITLLALMYLYAGFCFAEGLAELGLGFNGKIGGGIWWPMIVMGVLSVGAGLVAVFWPGLTALVLLVVIAISAILRGVLEIAVAVSLRKELEDEWVLILSGVLSIGFGALLLSAPGEGALALVLLIGAYMIAIGAMTVALSLRLRQLGRKLAGHAT